MEPANEQAQEEERRQERRQWRVWSKKHWDNHRNDQEWKDRRNSRRRKKRAENKAAGRQIRFERILPESPSATSVFAFTKDVAAMMTDKTFRFSENMVEKCLGNTKETRKPSQVDDDNDDDDDISLLSEGEVAEESKPPAKRAASASGDDRPIPKKRRVEEMEALNQKWCLHAAYTANPVLLRGKKVKMYDISAVEFSVHALYRLRVRGGILEDSDAKQLMEKGVILEQEGSTKYEGQFMVSYRDHFDVQHQFPLVFHDSGEVLVKTYFAISPFNGYRRRQMLDNLAWLSDILEVPLPLIGEHLARAIGDFPHGMIYHSDLGPKVMEVVKSILPTRNEIEFLSNIRFASEMGEPESWIVAVGKISNAATKVHKMRQMAYFMYDYGIPLDAMLKTADLVHAGGVPLDALLQMLRLMHHCGV